MKSSPTLTLKPSLRQRWFAMPEGADFTERRILANSRLATPATGLLHIFYFFLFAYWGVWLLALFNIFSIAVWTSLALLLISGRRRLDLVVVLAFIEIFMHTILVVLFLGWGFGAQYFLIVAVVSFALSSLWSNKVDLFVAFLCTLLFILLYYTSEFFPPLAAAPPAQLALVNILNITFTFGILLSYISYLIAETEKAESNLESEYQRSEALLENVLPPAIVARLKKAIGALPNPSESQPPSIAERFSDVSVLFADVVGFTTLSEQMPPNETVDLLNELFVAFDDLVLKYGVEKIRTIGDGYMVAAGAPQPLENHAHALAALALDMQAAMNRRWKSAESPLQLRIGINSGEAVGAILGTTKFHYDLWGDMVNTASRMESHGLPGQIQIARPTYDLIKDTFACHPRGRIEVKGKGPMEAWLLTGPL